MRIGITGARGRFGRALLQVFAGHEVIGWGREDFDIRDHGRMTDAILAARPDILINTAAFHNTDACEEDPEQAFSVNAIAVRHLAQACRTCGAILVQISTDYVFDGRQRRPYTETDRPNPLNVYGVSKLAGEQFVRAIGRQHYIVRVASLFGIAGASTKRSFVDLVLDKAKRGEPLVVVEDVVMSPTYTEDAARVIRALVEEQAPYGLYHAANAGACSWYAFALEILRAAGISADLRPTTTGALAPKAQRPQYSALDSPALAAAGVDAPRPWPDALRAYLEARQARAPI